MPAPRRWWTEAVRRGGQGFEDGGLGLRTFEVRQRDRRRLAKSRRSLATEEQFAEQHQALGGINRRDRGQGFAAPGLGQVVAAGNLLEGGDELLELKITSGLNPEANVIGISRRQQLPAKVACLRADAASRASPRSWVPC